MSMFHGKNVLMIGLGLLGGGVATANWLLRQGAQLTIFDLKSEEELAGSFSKLHGDYTFLSGKPREQDIDACDVVVVNPAISFHQQIIEYARSQKKHIENEATIFYNETALVSKIAITGTRGKTTVTNWVAHFLKSEQGALACGNSPDHPLLDVLAEEHKYSLYVVELPSFLLEFFDETVPASDIAIVTNISSDHLNRYDSMEEYVDMKARIFEHQSAEQDLILNFDSDWTQYLLNKKPRAKIWFFGRDILPITSRGLYVHDDILFFQHDGVSQELFSVADFAHAHGEHNLDNLMAAALAAHFKGASWQTIQDQITTLPSARFRQEIIFQNDRLTVVNDTTATSPDGSIAAIKRFASPTSFFIFGGTDAGLDYTEWGRVVAQYLKPEQIIFMAGSATEKMLDSLPWSRESFAMAGSLSDCLKAYQTRQLERHLSHATIIFSPGAKSFEKFNNEFDRGEQFNKLIFNIFKKE